MSGAGAPEPSTASIDVRALILDDLEDTRRRRSRYFLPALVLAVIALAGPLLAVGMRPDLWQQPPLVLGLQLVQWLVCLVAFPAIGLGLWFPRPAVRIALAVGGMALVSSAVVQIDPEGFMPPQSMGQALADPCFVVVVGMGIVLLVLGLFSGAFEQQRRTSSVFWLMGGIALAALNSITWHCAATDTTHVLVAHVGGAASVLLMVGIVGLIAHWRRRRLTDAELGAT